MLAGRKGNMTRFLKRYAFVVGFLATYLSLSFGWAGARPGTVYTPTPNAPTWQYTWTPGPSLANLFALYPSQGNVTISTATQIPTTLDGPIQVVRYGNLTVNAALTTTNRNRGLVILCDSLTMGASGSISMTARGAAGSSKWINQDILIPSSIVLTGQNTNLQAHLAWLASNGYAIWDPNLYAAPVPGMGDVTADYASWPGRGTAIISASGRGGFIVGAAVVQNSTPGVTGYAGTNAPGGGGRAAMWTSTTNSAAVTGRSGAANIWGGGPGTGGCSYAGQGPDADQYGGQGGNASGGYPTGGGAGNPPGTGANGGSTGANGTGGDLFIIVRGNVTVTAGHSITANGMPGGSAYGGEAGCGGGGSGAGVAAIIYSGTLAGTPSLSAAGGAGGISSGNCTNGGPGGAGATRVLTFTTMGY